MAVDHGALRLYLNGALGEHDDWLPGCIHARGAAPVRPRRELWDVPYTGLVDQLKIYDEAVNAEVVSQLYAEGAG